MRIEVMKPFEAGKYLRDAAIYKVAGVVVSNVGEAVEMFELVKERERYNLKENH